MNRRVRLGQAARRDFEEIADHLADRSLATALRFAAAVEASFSRLAESPGIGRRRPGEDAFLRSIRSWPVPGFENILLFYRPSTRGIDVVRIIHGARDIPVLLEEE